MLSRYEKVGMKEINGHLFPFKFFLFLMVTKFFFLFSEKCLMKLYMHTISSASNNITYVNIM